MTINHFTDFYNAEKLANNYDAVISLGHIINEDLILPHVKRLILNFSDITGEHMRFHGGNVTFADSPKEEHIKELAKFIKSLNPTDKLLIHCTAGYSRSAAGVAIARNIRDNLPMVIAADVDKLTDCGVPDTLVPKPNDLMISIYEKLLHDKAI